MRPLPLILLLAAVAAQLAHAAEPSPSPTWPLWDGEVRLVALEVVGGGAQGLDGPGAAVWRVARSNLLRGIR